MSSTQSFWFVPYRYVVPADMERWFEARAAEGFVAERIRQTSSFRMRLTRKAPATYRYVVDVQAAPRSDYRATYEDLGWEHVGQMASIHVWRRAYTGLRPEAFTDAPSARGRNVRFAVASGVAAAMLLPTALALIVAAVTTAGGAQLWVSAAVVGSLGVAVTVASITMFRTRRR